MSSPILPEPPDELKQLSRKLTERIDEEIRSKGFMSFAQFMERVLYEPGLGYYSAGLHKLGASGDFTTAPEMGCLFAACLARQVEQVAAILGDYDIIELGAGSGRLAVDLLRQIRPDRAPGKYRILERSADLRAVQKQLFEQQLPQWRDRVEWLDQLPKEPWHGLLLANEVIDALAIERFRITSQGVEQAGVGRSGDGYEWQFRTAPEDLKQGVDGLKLSVEPGFVSEINLQLNNWLQSISHSLQRGVALFIDYGYPRHEYYRAERRDGTLICHYRHRAHNDVFFWPGLQDLTAFVDFTALAEAADQCALQVDGYANQAMFLLSCGLDQVLAEQIARTTKSVGLELNAEARQLTLPGMMGERFQVMALSRDMETDLIGFALQDLRYRL